MRNNSRNFSCLIFRSRDVEVARTCIECKTTDSGRTTVTVFCILQQISLACCRVYCSVTTAALESASYTPYVAFCQWSLCLQGLYSSTGLDSRNRLDARSVSACLSSEALQHLLCVSTKLSFVLDLLLHSTMSLLSHFPCFCNCSAGARANPDAPLSCVCCRLFVHCVVSRV